MEKVKKIACLLLTSLLMVWGLSISSAFAAEGNGGAIQTKGQIRFYEEETEPSASSSDSSTPSSSDADSSQVDSSTVVKKPTGTYPSTGELVKKSLSITGGALLLITALLFLYRHKKREAER